MSHPIAAKQLCERAQALAGGCQLDHCSSAWQVGTAAEGGGAGKFGIRHSDSTFAIIRQNAAAMRK